MGDNIILTPRDKEILRGERGPDDYQDFDNRVYKIRGRVKDRAKTLAKELELLAESGEDEILEEVFGAIGAKGLEQPEEDMEIQVENLREELNKLEEEFQIEISALRKKITELEKKLNDRS